jgi:hypothetical protein
VADRYCRNCGHELAESDRFCPNCGTPVHEAAHVPTPEANRPVPPIPTTPAYGGGGGFLRSFGLGAGGCIGAVVALLLLFVGCAVIFSGGG